MLRELKIKNLAIIDDLTIRFDRGMNVLTGETGAGKSIIVDALGLALGDRAQTDMIRSGEKEAVVQAFFEVDNLEISSVPDIDISEGILLKRVISISGKSRAYINDNMIVLQTLSDVGRSLVDIHSQHEHQSLLTQEKQRRILDTYGQHDAELNRVEMLYKFVKSIKKERDGLALNIRERAQRIDLLRFQVEEIDAASLKPGEKESLEEERKILSNLSRLKELAAVSFSILYESEGACVERISEVISKLRDIQSIDQNISETLDLLESALPLVEDAARSLRAYRDKYDLDPDRLEQIEERLDLIKRLEKKYGQGIETILKYQKDAEAELEMLLQCDERLGAIENELSKQEAELLSAAQELSNKRKKTARHIEKLIQECLKELAMQGAQFKIILKQETDENGDLRITSTGMDSIEFLFSANPGEPPRPLSRIASGGELSRVMLALKSVLADADKVPVLIFDEVDAGIGGKTADSVGQKLKKLSERYQLICITHLPQIASLGDIHFKIEKKQMHDRVTVNITELKDIDRQDEIARMLSGSITAASLKHAEELLARAI